MKFQIDNIDSIINQSVNFVSAFIRIFFKEEIIEPRPITRKRKDFIEELEYISREQGINEIFEGDFLQKYFRELIITFDKMKGDWRMTSFFDTRERKIILIYIIIGLITILSSLGIYCFSSFDTLNIMKGLFVLLFSIFAMITGVRMLVFHFAKGENLLRIIAIFLEREIAILSVIFEKYSISFSVPDYENYIISAVGDLMGYNLIDYIKNNKDEYPSLYKAATMKCEFRKTVIEDSLEI